MPVAVVRVPASAGLDALAPPIARVGRTEHVEGLGLVQSPDTASRSRASLARRPAAFRWVVERSRLLPFTVERSLEENGLTVVTGSDERAFADKQEGDAGERRELDRVDGVGSGLWTGRVHDRDRRVVRCKRQSISAGRECHAVHPAAGRTGVLSAEVLNGSLSPQTVGSGFESTPFMYAENTRALPSALPAASRTELGCQSSERTVA